MSKISMLEDMDVQLRSQLEKIIVQRNQLGAEKAARDIEARTCDLQYSQFILCCRFVCLCPQQVRPGMYMWSSLLMCMSTVAARI